MAQKPAGIVKKNATFPVIDGIIDEIWATANTYNMDKIYRTETPSAEGSGETTWKALYDDNGIFLNSIEEPCNSIHWLSVTFDG